jgi:hypothetical protein
MIKRVQYLDFLAEMALNPTSGIPSIGQRFFRGMPFDPPLAVIRNSVLIRMDPSRRGRGTTVG